MEDLKILLLCCSRFAFPAMQEFVFHKQLGAVIIPSHCKEMINETEAALKGTDIPVIIVAKGDLEKKALQVISEQNINIGFVFTFSFLIPAKVYSATTKGFYNVHPGSLPAYRGADPIFYQIKNREPFAAVSIHIIDDGADTGAIVLQENIRLSVDDTYGMLEEKLSYLAIKLAGTLLKIISLGFALQSKQQDESKAHYYDIQELHELTIDWKLMGADDIIALMNACNPYNKGAATRLNNKIIRLLVAGKYDIGAPDQASPGTIISIDDNRMDVAVINNELLSISFLYIDEGFVTPSYLIRSGVRKNMMFQNVF